ncbi:MAG: diguanylate cyclase [Erysipelotrichaceae bacterium]
MKKNKMFKRIILIVVFITAIVIVTADFIMTSYSLINKNTYTELEENAIHYNEILDIQIKGKMHLMESVAKNIEIIPEKSKDHIIDVLNTEINNENFDYLSLSDLNGVSIFNNGLSDHLENNEYFKRALNGEKSISDPIYSKELDSNILIFVVPCYENNKVSGVLRGIYNVNKLSNSVATFSRTGYGFIVGEDGTIILNSDHKDKVCNGNNLFDFFKQKDIKNSLSVKEFQEMIEKKETKTFTYTYQGEKRYATFMAMGMNDWYTFSFASDSTLKNEANRLNAITFQLVIKILIIFILLSIYLTLQRAKQQKRLKASNDNYETLVANIKGGVITTMREMEHSEYGIVTYASQGFYEMTGYTKADIDRMFNGRYRSIVDQRDLYKFEEEYFTSNIEGAAYSMQYRIVKKDGSIIWVMDNSHIVIDENENRIDHGILTDITDIKKQEDNLKLSEARFKIATQLSSSYISEFDLVSLRYTHVENAEGFFKMSSDEIMKETDAFTKGTIKEAILNNIHYFYDEADYKVVFDAYQTLFEKYSCDFEARVKLRQGASLWCQVHLVLIIDEEKKPIRMIATMSDVDGIKRETLQLKIETQLDPLTGIYNKVATQSIVDRILIEDNEMVHALMMIDVDNFKGVNDTLGHMFGDAVLMEVLAKLKKMFRSQDILGRVGGDEFLIFMRDIKDPSIAYKKAQDICKAFKKTYIGEKQEYQISCSVGVVISQANENFASLFNKADIALYQAKENGKDRFHAYNGEENHHVELRAERQANIKKLDENDQPIMLIKDRVFEILYETHDFGSSINLVLALLGRIHDVNHVYIFEVCEDQKHMRNTYEWCSENTLKFMDQLKFVKMPDTIDAYFDQTNDSFYCPDVDAIDSDIRYLIIDKKVKSLLQILVKDNQKPFCFIGFDDYNDNDGYSSDEISALRDAAKIIGVFLKKHRLEEACNQKD